MKVIEIIIAVPDGVEVDVRTKASGGPVTEPQYTPAFADELIPLPPDAIPIKGDIVQELAAAQVTPFRGAAQNPSPGCPVHKVPWKTVPAGISKKTGRPYDAFLACPERGCDQRPA